MTTKDFKLRDDNLDSFIDFAAGDPYCLDFGAGGQQGTISWRRPSATALESTQCAEMCTVQYLSIAGGFEIGYDAQEDEEIVSQIAVTVQAYNAIGSAGAPDATRAHM